MEHRILIDQDEHIMIIAALLKSFSGKQFKMTAGATAIAPAASNRS